MSKPASEVIKPYVEQFPEHKFAITDSELGVWIESESRYLPFASLTIMDYWVSMPYEILVNGQRLERNWIPVTQVI